MGIIFGFTGCSGSGKSTLLNYIKTKYNVECKELSARPFLNKNNGSYDKQMNDDIQMNIMYNNIEQTYRYLNIINTTNKNIAVSRTLIDVLAYSRVLNHGLCCEKQEIETIKYLKDKIIFLYTIPDFNLKINDEKDTLRGMNEEIRLKTDKKIYEILTELNIPYIKIYGNLENRKKIIDNLMYKNNIYDL